MGGGDGERHTGSQEHYRGGERTQSGSRPQLGGLDKDKDKPLQGPSILSRDRGSSQSSRPLAAEQRLSLRSPRRADSLPRRADSPPRRARSPPRRADSPPSKARSLSRHCESRRSRSPRRDSRSRSRPRAGRRHALRVGGSRGASRSRSPRSLSGRRGSTERARRRASRDREEKESTRSSGREPSGRRPLRGAPSPGGPRSPTGGSRRDRGSLVHPGKAEVQRPSPPPTRAEAARDSQENRSPKHSKWNSGEPQRSRGSLETAGAPVPDQSLTRYSDERVPGRGESFRREDCARGVRRSRSPRSGPSALGTRRDPGPTRTSHGRKEPHLKTGRDCSRGHVSAHRNAAGPCPQGEAEAPSRPSGRVPSPDRRGGSLPGAPETQGPSKFTGDRGAGSVPRAAAGPVADLCDVGYRSQSGNSLRGTCGVQCRRDRSRSGEGQDVEVQATDAGPHMRRATPDTGTLVISQAGVTRDRGAVGGDEDRQHAVVAGAALQGPSLPVPLDPSEQTRYISGDKAGGLERELGIGAPGLADVEELEKRGREGSVPAPFREPALDFFSPEVRPSPDAGAGPWRPPYLI